MDIGICIIASLGLDTRQYFSCFNNVYLQQPPLSQNLLYSRALASTYANNASRNATATVKPNPSKRSLRNIDYLIKEIKVINYIIKIFFKNTQ